MRFLGDDLKQITIHQKIYNRPLVLALVDLHKPFDIIQLPAVLQAFQVYKIDYQFCL